jgi:hypothetical protein
VLLATCLLALQWLAAAMVRLARRRSANLAADQQGTAVLEFALLFPVAMAIVLLMVQTSMMMTANLYVHYAAYAAARSAVVLVPLDEPLPDGHVCYAYYYDYDSNSRVCQQVAECERNRLNAWKESRIRQAAVLALVPAAGSPQQMTISGDSQGLQSGLAALFGRYGEIPPVWLGEKLALKYEYANRYTDVEIDDPVLDAFASREDVTVTVTHRCFIGIPFVRAAFGGEPLPGMPGQYASEVKATYTLINQGSFDNVLIEKDSSQSQHPLGPYPPYP